MGAAADAAVQDHFDLAANGVDPTQANNDGFNTFSTEVSSGGALDLKAEESDSWSAGFAFEQPFTNAFGLSLSATYYEIDVRNTIIEPTAQTVDALMKLELAAGVDVEIKL